MSTIVIWMLIFTVTHSLMADARVKQFLHNRLGERVYHGFYRFAYNAIAALQLLPIALALVTQGQTLYTLPPLLQVISLLLQGIGAVGLLAALLQIDLLRFAGVRQVIAYLRNEPLPLPPEPLQTNGLYRFVRHPLYLFSLLMIWPVSPMTDTLLAFNLAATAYFIIGSVFEERRMLAVYGEAYRAYQEQVPWLIPLPKRG